jgi:UDP-N-acetylmuramate--alanine ligase
MLVHGLRAIGADPSFLLGGELPGAGPQGAHANAGWGAGEWIVAEADESDGSFLRMSPEVAVVTNVELDHHSRWRTRVELVEAFREFAAPAAGLALGAGGDLDRIVGSQRVIRFDADKPGPGELRLSVPGWHNRFDARGAIAGAELAGADPVAFADSLTGFPGMARRLERKGVHRSGATVYDDYAHHPTEVAASLEALRELGPRRLIAVFQPHLYSRTKAFGEEFGAALALADEAVVLDVYPAREQPVGELAGVSGLRVAQAAAERMGGRRVCWLPDAEGAERVLADLLDRNRRLGLGDQVLVTIGAGDVFRLGEHLVGEGAS